MTPSQIGERTEAAVLEALVRAGKSVAIPFGGWQRYDLVYEDQNGSFVRVQCKSGRLQKGAIEFAVCSRTGNVEKDYVGQIDAFGVYCAALDDVYIVPIEDLRSTHTARLRVDPPKNGQRAGIKWAADYAVSVSR